MSAGGELRLPWGELQTCQCGPPAAVSCCPLATAPCLLHLPAMPACPCSTTAEKDKRNITDVGEGMLEGAGAIGSSMLRGFRGLIEKPLQGAQAGGAKGAPWGH